MAGQVALQLQEYGTSFVAVLCHLCALIYLLFRVEEYAGIGGANQKTYELNIIVKYALLER